MSSKPKPIEMDIGVDPWERQTGETDPAWEAFRNYRDMVTWNDGKRSLRRLAEHLGKHRVHVERWSVANHWQMRCTEWDRHLDEIARAEYEQEIKNMQKRHAQAAQMFQQIFTFIPQALLTKMRNDPESVMPVLESMSAAELIDMAMRGAYASAAAVKVERLSRGVSTSNVEQHVHGDVTVQANNELLGLLRDTETRAAMKTIATRVIELEHEEAG